MTGDPAYRALLIGVWDYAADSGFKPLLGPPNDVRELGRILRDSKVGIFAVKELLNPTTGSLRTGVQKFLDLADKNDNLLLYFSGHGESSAKNGQLCLMSAEGDRAALDGSSLSFLECYEWIRDSPARSVTVILDCCRAGSAFKGSGPDFTKFFSDSSKVNRPIPHKAIKILSVGSGFENALDAKKSIDTSPFTAQLCEALSSTAVADENGLVPLHAVVASIRSAATESTLAPRVWGTDEAEGPYLAQRPQYVDQLLDAAGLRETRMERTGAASHDGRDLHVDVQQADHIVSHLMNNHPTTAYVGGLIGSGKTWILCDVGERLLEHGWHVVALQPSREPFSAQKLWSALKKYAARLRDTNDRSLIIIDGIEWTDTWAEFVSGLQELAELEGFGVSILSSLETQRGQRQSEDVYESWETGSLTLASITQGGIPEFVAAVMSPERNSEYAKWDHARLTRARADLSRLVGVDLWAAVHLGSVWYDPAAEELVIRKVWRDRIGKVTPRQVKALQTVASLGRFNLWCPLALALEAGDILIRLGAEYSRKYDSVRFNSGFLNRALLARHTSDGKVEYSMDPGAANRIALQFIARYLRDVLLDENGQQQAITTLSKLRYDRRVLDITMRRLRQISTRGSSVWEQWADNWADLSLVVQIMSFVRTSLTLAEAATLGDRLCAYVVENTDDIVALPTLVSSLELLRDLHRGRRVPTSLNEAYERLASLAERQLELQRWPPRLRRRLLRVLRRINWLDERTIQRIGQNALRPSSPPGIADMTLVLDFVKLVSPGRHNEMLRAQLATWDVVTDDLVRSPEDDGNRIGMEQLAVRRILAHYVYDEEYASQLSRILVARMQRAGAADLERVLSTCVRFDKRYAAELAGRLSVQDWSRSVYRRASPYTTACLVNALGRIRPDLAVRTFRLPDDALDSQLAKELAATIRSDGDAVSAGMLLKTSARLEEQRGILDGGFAQLLCAELGTDLLADMVRNDSRLSIVTHLIEAYAAVRSPLLESLRRTLLEIVESQINSSGSVNGPRLTLILSDDDVLGESFIEELRARKTILPATMLARMRDVRNPGALAAYHELSVMIFPLIEYKFLEEIEESGNPWTDSTLFDDLANHGNVINALRAAVAVMTTLVLSGKSTPGTVILEAFQRASTASSPGREWTNRLLEADDFDLAEGLRLLNRLQSGAAQRLCEKHSTRVLNAMRRSPPRVFAALLSTVARISSEAGDRLVSQCENEELISDVLDDLAFDENLFDQAAALSSLAAAEDRLFRHIVPGPFAERFREFWAKEVSVINNPELVAAFIRIAGNGGREAALKVGHAVNIGSLRRRLARRNAADAPGYANLIRLLGELTPNVLRTLMDDQDAQYLLWRTPIKSLAGLSETLVETGVITARHTDAILALRLNLAPDKVPMRNRHRYWLSVGWSAWVAARQGGRLELDHDLDPRVIASMEPHVTLWALAWFRPETWANSLIDEAIERLRRLDVPPSGPSAAAAVLTACCTLGKEDELLGPNPTMSAWRHALDADPWWIRSLVFAAQPGTRLNEAFRTDWALWDVKRLRLALTWRSHGWRKVPQEAETAITGLLKAGEVQRASRPPRQSR
jgi:hypothetical protein